MFDIWNKVFSLNFDMDNLNQSTILGNFKWNFVKHMKNSDLYSSLGHTDHTPFPPFSLFPPIIVHCMLSKHIETSSVGQSKQMAK